MKRKKLFNILLIAMLVLSMAVVGVGAGTYPGGPGTTIWVDDQDAHFGPSPDPGNLTCTRFNVSINIQNVADLGAWEFKMSYNKSLITAEYVYSTSDTSICTDWVPIDGGVWHPDTYPTIDETGTNGVVWTGALFPSGQEFNGNGTLVKIRFHIIYAPTPMIGQDVWANCSLHLYDTALKDSIMSDISHAKIDGKYSYGRAALVPGAPVACFEWGITYPLTSPPAVYVCDNVTLDASCSTPNGGSIIAYIWCITGPADPIGPLSGMVTWFHCNGTGIVTVTLVVVDSEAMQSPPCVHEIEQIEKVGCKLDVYTGNLRHQTNFWTPFVGKEENVNADAFAPGDEVWLYVHATYNGAPVNHVLVAIEVLWEYEERSDPCNPEQILVPKNDCIAYRTGETNKSGIALVMVRIPLPTCQYPESYYPFGKWLVIVTAKIQDVKQTDTLRFDVNYLVRIVDMWTTHDGVPEDTFYRIDDGEEDLMDFCVVLKSITWIPMEAWIIVVIYDECNVPLGQLIYMVPTPPADYCHPEEMIVCIGYLPIPQWATVGNGKVYYNVFTALPHACGVPFAPECSTDILIKWPGPRP